MDCQKITDRLLKMSGKKSKKTKPKYVKKEISYCLKCGRKTKNENIKGVALENKIGQQKSTPCLRFFEVNFFKTNNQ